MRWGGEAGVDGQENEKSCREKTKDEESGGGEGGWWWWVRRLVGGGRLSAKHIKTPFLDGRLWETRRRVKCLNLAKRERI